MATQRVLAPANGGRVIDTGFGRSYKAVPGLVLDVPEGDAFVLEANGWPRVNRGGCGPSAERPLNPMVASIYGLYFDTDLGKLILWDGADWRDPADGSVV